MKKRKETKDLCEFCSTFWDVDRREICKTPCSCAAFANQDYVYQRESTVGLPVPCSWPVKRDNHTNFFRDLNDAERKRVSERYLVLLQEVDPILGMFLTLLVQDATQKEICEKLEITEETYRKYAQRLRDIAHDVR